MSEIINGRYLLQNEIGAGGMGSVYRAYDRLSGQTVALKQVRLNQELQLGASISPYDTREALRLILAKEFQILAGLRHPNIIPVLDYGFDSERQPFYTMNLLEESQTILEAGAALDVEGKIGLIEQLLQGLAYLHRRGILHRDIKPENVLVTGGMVKLLDFGLSHAADEEGGLGGSPLYIAPEVFEGEDAATHSDLYAVGILLYQLLTGQHPFGQFDTDFYRRLLTLEPDLSLVDDRFSLLLERLLVKRPTGRPETAHDALRLLNEAWGRSESAETVAIRESYLQAATFVGRDAELERLTIALNGAKAGESSAWLIGGESGVGKSRLLDELQTQAMVDGWQVLRGQAVQSGSLPYQLWRTIVPHLVLNTAFSTVELSILKEIVPELDRLVNETIPVLAASNGSIDQERLVSTLVDALKRQNRPTLLLLEDLHWTHESMVPLKEIVGRIGRMPQLMVILTYRSDEAPHLPVELPEAESLLLGRLSKAEVKQLTQAILGDRANGSEIASLLAQETEGNTFFIVEVMRALAEEAGKLDEISGMTLPDGVLTRGMESLLRRRIQQVSSADQLLLQKVAVAGRQLDLQLLSYIAPNEEIGGSLQRALDAAVLSVRDNQWFFSHDKLRETIVNGLNSETRQRHHRQVAEALEGLYPGARRYDQSLLEHWHQAGDLDKEIEYLEPVAQYMIQSIADLDPARRLLTRGLDQLHDSDPRRIPLLNWLASTYSEKFDKENLELAFEMTNRALQLAEAVGDTLHIADSLYRLGSIRFLIGHADEETAAYAEKSLQQARLLGDQHKISDNLMLLGEIAHHRGNFEEALAYHQEGLAVSEEIGSPYRVGFSLDHIGQSYVVLGEYEKAVEYLQRSLEAYEAGGYKQRLGWTLINLANLPMLLGRYEEAAKHLRRCLAIFRKYDVPLGIAYGLNNLSRIATLEGKYDKAKEYLHHSNDIFRSSGLIRGMGYNLLQLGLIGLIEGEYEAAEGYLQQGLAGFQEVGETRFMAYCLSRLGFVYLNIKPDQARSTLLEALRLAYSLEIEPCLLEIVFGFAYLYLKNGELRRAGELIGLAQHHPKSNKEIQLLLRIIYPELIKVMPMVEQAEAIEYGKMLPLEEVVLELLGHHKLRMSLFDESVS